MSLTTVKRSRDSTPVATHSRNILGPVMPPLWWGPLFAKPSPRNSLLGHLLTDTSPDSLNPKLRTDFRPRNDHHASDILLLFFLSPSGLIILSYYRHLCY